MKRFIKNKILNFITSKGYTKVLPGIDPKDVLYDGMKLVFKPKNKEIISVIFSKDRAMQLDGFLVSYFANVAHYGKVIVLYHTSSAEHEQSYTDLRKIYQDQPVEFVKETNFREQLINSLKNTPEDLVMFYVDDMLFSQKVDYHWFKDIDPLEDIVCLSRGKDLVYSTVLVKELKVPQIKPLKENLYRFKWNEIDEFSDWTYPLGVSGYMFSKPEIVAMMEVTPFKAPNSLEHNLQRFVSYFMNRGGITLENVATPCVHTNLTQTEGYNNVLGHYSLEELLVLWNDNKRIDYQEFMNLPVSEAEVKKYNFVER